MLSKDEILDNYRERVINIKKDHEQELKKAREDAETKLKKKFNEYQIKLSKTHQRTLKKARAEGQKEIAIAWLDVMAGFDKGSDLEKLIYNFWGKLSDILDGDIEKLKSGSEEKEVGEE